MTCATRRRRRRRRRRRLRRCRQLRRWREGEGGYHSPAGCFGHAGHAGHANSVVDLLLAPHAFPPPPPPRSFSRPAFPLLRAAQEQDERGGGGSDKQEKLWALMASYLASDVQSIQRSVANHVEYTLAGSRFNFDRFRAYVATAHRCELVGRRRMRGACAARARRVRSARLGEASRLAPLSSPAHCLTPVPR